MTQVAVVVVHYPEVLAGAQLDSDGYFRLVRVEHLLATGAWFDPTIPSSNWPYGQILHWTRPLDVLILLLIAPLKLAFSTEVALAIAGSVISPIFHAALCVMGVWVIAPLVHAPARFLIMPAILAQPGAIAYGTAGRADHHLLVLFLCFLALGAWIRSLRDPIGREPATAAGLLSAGAVWVSPEALIALAVIFASGAVAWIAYGGKYANPNVVLCRALVVGILVAILIERPAAGWLLAEYDRISIAHLTMGLIALGFWGAIAAISRRTHRPTERALWAGMGGALALVAIRLVHPEFFLGPTAHIDPHMRATLIPLIDELRPLLPYDLASWGRFISLLGSAIWVIPFAAWAVMRAQGPPGARMGWLVVLAALIVFVPFASLQQRFVGYAGVAMALGTVGLTSEILARAEGIERASLRRASRIGAMAGIIVGAFLVGSGLEAAASATSPDSDLTAADRRGRCDVRGIAELLMRERPYSVEPQVIATSPNVGPELVYRTHHRILAGPYHRSYEGLEALMTLFTSEELSRARSIAESRHIDLVLLCPDDDQGHLGLGGPESLYGILTSDEGVPDWIEAVPLAGPPGEGFLLFETRIRE